MADKYCPFKTSGDDRTCDKSNCEWWVETSTSEGELDKCAMFLIAQMELSRFSAKLRDE